MAGNRNQLETASFFLKASGTEKATKGKSPLVGTGLWPETPSRGKPASARQDPPQDSKFQPLKTQCLKAILASTNQALEASLQHFTLAKQTHSTRWSTSLEPRTVVATLMGSSQAWKNRKPVEALAKMSQTLCKNRKVRKKWLMKLCKDRVWNFDAGLWRFLQENFPPANPSKANLFARTEKFEKIAYETLQGSRVEFRSKNLALPARKPSSRKCLKTQSLCKGVCVKRGVGNEEL